MHVNASKYSIQKDTESVDILCGAESVCTMNKNEQKYTHSIRPYLGKQATTSL